MDTETKGRGMRDALAEIFRRAGYATTTPQARKFMDEIFAYVTTPAAPEPQGGVAALNDAREWMARSFPGCKIFENRVQSLAALLQKHRDSK